MFDKILVAIDTSSSSRAVFEAALTLAKQTQASLMLLHVLAPDSQDYAALPPTLVPYSYPIITDEVMRYYREQWEAAERKGLTILQSLADEASRAGVAVEFSQNVGNPSQWICDLAKDWQADLIIMGRRGHSGFSELFLGSVSNYVMHHACCSVLTVQGEKVKQLESSPELATTGQA